MISCEISQDVLNTFLQALAIPQLKILTFIRRPIDHVMSAFLHYKGHHRNDACRSFDAIFQSIAANQSRDSAPRRSQECAHYDIRNMQTTALTLPSSSSQKGANLTAAIAFISKSVFFFGITEYYRASLCLLAYQLGQLEMHRRLCDCSKMQTAVTVKHSNAVRDQAETTVNHDELSIDMMKTLERDYINLDNMLYHVALQVFLQRVIIAERASGMQLVCEASDGVEVSTLKASISNPDWYNNAGRG